MQKLGFPCKKTTVIALLLSISFCKQSESKSEAVMEKKLKNVNELSVPENFMGLFAMNTQEIKEKITTFCWKKNKAL